jgi:hypothetical protein
MRLIDSSADLPLGGRNTIKGSLQLGAGRSALKFKIILRVLLFKALLEISSLAQKKIV